MLELATQQIAVWSVSTLNFQPNVVLIDLVNLLILSMDATQSFVCVFLLYESG
jgi:hypothetical protein